MPPGGYPIAVKYITSSYHLLGALAASVTTYRLGGHPERRFHEHQKERMSIS